MAWVNWYCGYEVGILLLLENSVFVKAERFHGCNAVQLDVVFAVGMARLVFLVLA